MCFSAEASFAVGGLLIPMGGFCLWSAVRKNPRFLGLAAVPLAFAIQQIGEGFVWLALHDQREHAAHDAALVFLFFAVAFWPFAFPAIATLVEQQRARRWLLGFVSLLALAWFWMLYYPLLVGEESLLQINIAHHSIRYEYPNLPIYRHIGQPLLRLLYLLTLASPFLISSERWGVIPGLFLLASVVIAIVFFDYAFVSVWCFFAAVMASYCCIICYRLPTRPIAQSSWS